MCLGRGGAYLGNEVGLELHLANFDLSRHDANSSSSSSKSRCPNKTSCGGSISLLGVTTRIHNSFELSQRITHILTTLESIRFITHPQTVVLA